MLRPVSYTKNFEKENAIKGIETPPLDPTNNYEKIRYSGFIAQEVEAAAKELNYDFSGVDKPKNNSDLYGLRYSDFVVPMVKAIQEQQSMIEEQMKLITEMKNENEKLKAALEELKVKSTAEVIE